MIEYKNCKYVIDFDDYTTSPDSWQDDEIFLVYDHRDLFVSREGFNPADIHAYLSGSKDFDFSEYYLFPVYAHIHSGIGLSLTHDGDKWDTSMRGYVVVNKELIKGLTEEVAKSYAKNLLNDWTYFLSGEVYCYYIYDEYDNLIATCGGYYDGDDCERDAIYYIENRQ
jgi:hypothetical protein